jgi:hypothetical protein
MHGVGVFDYATVPGKIKTQVYMCPTAICNAEMLAAGECLTFIMGVAIQLNNVYPKRLVMLRNSWMKIDHVERQNETNISLGQAGAVAIKASGRGSATDVTARIDHESLADCHVLTAAGQPATVVGEPATAAPKAATQMRAQGDGGVWKDCTNNEWTLSMHALTLDIGVIGPFEEGFLRENVSDRTFNLNLRDVVDPDGLQGIINGDKNGLFQLDPAYNDATNTLEPGQPVPFGPHGYVQEVVAPNVDPEHVLFPQASIARMDAICGQPQSMRAIQVSDDVVASDDLTRGWKEWKTQGWKSRSPPK